jgi:hypothetical protein
MNIYINILHFDIILQYIIIIIKADVLHQILPKHPLKFNIKRVTGYAILTKSRHDFMKTKIYYRLIKWEKKKSGFPNSFFCESPPC